MSDFDSRSYVIIALKAHRNFIVSLMNWYAVTVLWNQRENEKSVYLLIFYFSKHDAEFH